MKNLPFVRLSERARTTRRGQGINRIDASDRIVKLVREAQTAFGESAPEKVEILRGAGVTVAPNPSELGATMATVLSGSGAAPLAASI